LPEQERAGIYVGPSAQGIWLGDNRFQGCFPDMIADPASLAEEARSLKCGMDAVQDVDLRHLFSLSGGRG
jgi:hypothetical protein